MLSSISCVFSILYVLKFVRPISCDIYRLPNSITPKHYKLKILTSVEDDLLYKGNLEIVVQCLNATKQISLHRDWSIKFEKVELQEIDTVQNYKKKHGIPLDKVLYSNKTQFLMISTVDELKENQHYLLRFEFQGSLSDTPSGLFRGSFPTASDTSYYVMSIFEPTGARKAFPCFDEPGKLATFEIIIGRKQKYNTTSNMPLVKSEPVEDKDGWYWDHFMNTFPLSTYLVCFVIYEAEKFEWTEKQGDQKIRILVRTEMKPSMGMVTKTAPKLFAYLQKYFQVPFPYTKLDVVAVPNKMGNRDSTPTPGLVIMHENSLSYKAFGVKQHDVQEILYKIAEKICLQWISMIAIDWWSDMWIKNSLILFNTRIALKEMTETHSLEIDIADALLQFFQHPSIQPVPEEVYADAASIESAISPWNNAKGVLLLRMVRYMTGNKDLKRLSTDFLKKNSFQTVNQQDLWQMFESQIPRKIFDGRASLHDVISSWMKQSSYPEIEVRREYNSSTAVLKQIEYRSKNDDDKKNSCWWIPITYTLMSDNVNKSSNVRGWLSCPKKTSLLKGLPSEGWILLNVQVNSLCRVNYDIQNWKLLHATLENPLLYKNIAPLNRLQLVNDIFEFTTRGNLTYQFLFTFLEFLKFDDSYAPWASLSKNIFNIYWQFEPDTNAKNLLLSYVQNLVKRHFHNRKHRREQYSETTIIFEVLITEISCFFKLPECLKEVKDGFERYRNMKYPFHVDSPFSIDLREIVFCYTIKHGGAEEFNYLLDAYSKSEDVFEQTDMLKALHCTKDVAMLKTIPDGKRIKRNIENLQNRNFYLRKREDILSQTDETERPGSASGGIVSDVSTANDSVTDESAADGSGSGVTAPDESISDVTASHGSVSDGDAADGTATNETAANNIAVNETVVNDNEETTTETTLSESGISEDISGIDSPTTSENESTSEDQDSKKTKGDDLNFGQIISRGDFGVVSEMFYRDIKKMDLKLALKYIWLFTERIKSNEDLDKLKKFIEDNEEYFSEIRDQIEERIEYVENNLVRRKRDRDSVVEALKKYDTKLQSRSLNSNATKIFISYVLYFLCVFDRFFL